MYILYCMMFSILLNIVNYKENRVNSWSKPKPTLRSSLSCPKPQTKQSINSRREQKGLLLNTNRFFELFNSRSLQSADGGGHGSGCPIQCAVPASLQFVVVLLKLNPSNKTNIGPG